MGSGEGNQISDNHSKEYIDNHIYDIKDFITQPRFIPIININKSIKLFDERKTIEKKTA